MNERISSEGPDMGMFVISLDFELHWGGFEKWPIESRKDYFRNTRQVIPEMLRVFEANDVHVTWAAVGFLLHPNRQSMKKASPQLTPTYTDQRLSAYEYINSHGIGEDEESDPFHYAASLVHRILGTKGQELGSHTFGHYYCNEPGQTLEQFRADLKAAQQSAALYDKKLRSLVFPRNQFNEDYLRVCHEEGFVVVRDNPRDWFWNIQSTQSESLWKRFNRGADAYFGLGKNNTYRLSDIEVKPGLPLCLPASRLLRPYNPKELFLNDMKIDRVRAEMEKAAKNDEVYHIWWHPHNFGNYPAESLQGLEKIIKHFERCRKEYGMLSLSMGEVADHVLHAHGKTTAA